MDQDRQLARLALSLVEGVCTNEPGAEDLLTDTFEDLGEAARAHAYLAGFLLQALAVHRQESLDRTSLYIKSVIDRA